MKLRIKKNGLRYRLTRTDVDRLSKEGYLEEQVSFPGNNFIYSLQLTEEQELTANFMNNKITISMPRQMVKELINTDRVGFENNYEGIELLIEKDFVCLDTVAEDQSDNYPNPLAER